ncbi:MAG: hypothetical protein GY865_09395 [candidate division Zixibacteria bacterium]|nr:hypothetical protein [candidate division Zixibacteria bacterium]
MYKISNQTDWRDARHKIEDAIAVGIDLNNSISPSAVITQINTDGFNINIGGLRDIELKWSILEHCWKELCDDDDCLDRTGFENPFGQALLDEDSLNFLVCRLLKKSGLIVIDNKGQMKLQF